MYFTCDICGRLCDKDDAGKSPGECVTCSRIALGPHAPYRRVADLTAGELIRMIREVLYEVLRSQYAAPRAWEKRR